MNPSTSVKAAATSSRLRLRDRVRTGLRSLALAGGAEAVGIIGGEPKVCKSFLALDMAVFINGLPIATFELKNKLTKQTVLDAIEQYKRDRDPRELLFQFGRCMVHFAVDDHEVRFCISYPIPALH